MNNAQVRVIDSINRDTSPINLDTYQCNDCGEFSHHEQVIHTAPHGKPQFCPYCGSKAIEWRDDDLYALVEYAK